MRTAIKLILGLLALIIVAGATVFFFFPGKIVDWTNASYASAASVAGKTISVDGETIHYFASDNMDKEETLVLVHGLGDDKNSFLQSSATLSEQYNLILPDLRGHGENSRDQEGDYSIAGQAKLLHSFLSELGVKRFHLAGNSMGGHISAAYALRYPTEVATLTLVNAPGVSFPGVEIYTGFGEPLQSREDLEKVMQRIMYKPPSLPGPIADHMIEQVNAGLDFTDNVMIPGIKGGEDFDLAGRLSGIGAPTLILWGEHDPVVDFKVAEYFDRHVPLSKIEVLPEASHSPQLEHPDAVADAILTFLSENKTTMIQSQRTQHAAKTQLYRWYTLYEGELSKARIANQLNLLDEYVTITSAAGEMKGRANYPARLAVYKGWKNAHHVQNITVEPADDGTIAMQADIVYQNITPDGKEAAYTVHYENQLNAPDGDYPTFKSLNLQPTGELPARPFEDAYANNRLRSLMHAWLYNMEALDGEVEPFRELLADDFYLNFSSGSQIKSIGELKTWLNSTPLTLDRSSHYPINFTVADGDRPNTYKMTVDFVWFGVAKDGNAYKTVTSHAWQVEDDPTERFARIKRADVTQKVPFGPI